MRYLAIDHGTRRTGLAVCDAGETIASPLKTLYGRDTLPETIAQVVETEEIGAVVLGLPLNMDGSLGPQAKCVVAFSERLKARITVPVHFQDERLSSFAAEEKLQATGLSRAKQKGLRDAVAAAEILQAFLDQKQAL